MKPQQTKLEKALGIPPQAPWGYRAKTGKYWHLSHDGDRMLCGRRIRPARYFPIYERQISRVPNFTCWRCLEKFRAETGEPEIAS